MGKTMKGFGSLLVISTYFFVSSALASTISSSYERQIMKKQCVKSFNSTPSQIFNKYDIKTSGLSASENKQVAQVFSVLDRGESSKVKKLLKGVKIKAVPKLNSDVGGGRYRGGGLVLMGRRKPRSGRAIRFSPVRVIHETCHHFGHQHGLGDENNHLDKVNSKKNGKKKLYDAYRSAGKCSPKGSSYGRAGHKHNENFAETCTAFLLHPEAIKHCPGHLKFFEKAFGMKSKCHQGEVDKSDPFNKYDPQKSKQGQSIAI